jgi:hypothetical protein
VNVDDSNRSYEKARRYAIEWLIALILSLAGSIYCFSTHMCMCGHLAHINGITGNFTFEYVIDGIWICAILIVVVRFFMIFKKMSMVKASPLLLFLTFPILQSTYTIAQVIDGVLGIFK